MIKKFIERFINAILGDELEYLNMALCDAYSEGKLNAEDCAAYNRHAFQCKEAGIERKTWPEFFGRTVEPTGYHWK